MLDKKPISSALAGLFVIEPGELRVEPLVFCENLTASKRIRSENVPELGQYNPREGVVNYEEGQLTIGRFLTRDPILTAIVTPRLALYATWQNFDLLVMDPRDGKILCLAQGINPTSYDIILRAGTAARNNYTAICKAILVDDEVSKALSL